MPLLEARKIDKSFGGLQALNAVSLTIDPGDIFGLIGPNGAGKTTLFNVLTGLYKPDGGAVLFNSVDVTGKKANRVVEAGKARTFQNIKLFGNIDAVENVKRGRRRRGRAG